MLYASLMLKWKLDITDCDLKGETLGKGEPRVMGVSLQLSGCSQRDRFSSLCRSFGYHDTGANQSQDRLFRPG